MEIRDAKDEDKDGLIALMRAIFVEYQCVFDLAELPELSAFASYFAEAGGRAWVALHEGRIVGSVGLTPSAAPGGVELRKLYVASEMRGTGLSNDLYARIEREAQARGASFIDLWTDTRFTRAHRFYARNGYVKGPTTRELHDKSQSVEFYFRRSLIG